MNANELTDKQKKLKLNLKTAPTYHTFPRYEAIRTFRILLQLVQLEKLYENFWFLLFFGSLSASFFIIFYLCERKSYYYAM